MHASVNCDPGSCVSLLSEYACLINSNAGTTALCQTSSGDTIAKDYNLYKSAGKFLPAPIIVLLMSFCVNSGIKSLMTSIVEHKAYILCLSSPDACLIIFMQKAQALPA